MKYFKSIHGALNSVGQDYIVVPAIHRVDGLARERVFCYEFYHQLRKKLRTEKIVVHGELDKSTYPNFQNEKPDFVLHKAGSNLSNAVVLEVKMEIGVHKIEQDIIKLFRFITDYSYHSAGLFIVGFDDEVVARILGPLFKRYKNHQGSDKVLVFVLPESGKCIEPKAINFF